MNFILSILISLFLTGCLFAQSETWNLSQCIDYAFSNDLGIQESTLNTAYQKKEVMGAYGRLLPSVNAYANHQYNFGSVIDPTTNSRVSSDIQSNSFGLSASVELFNWGNFVRIKTAKLKKEQAEYDLEVKYNDLVIKIVQAFSQVQYDKEQIKLAQEQLENGQIHLKRIEREVELGNKAKSDLYEILAGNAANEQQLLLAQNTYKESKLVLLNLLNLTKEIDFEDEVIPLPTLISESVTSLYEKGLLIRPEIQSAQIQEEISKQDVKEKQSQYFPTIEGGYSLSSFYVDSQTASFNDQFKNNKNHYLGLSLNIPIFNRFQTKIGVQQAKIEEEKAKLQLAQQKQNYFQALNEAYLKTQNAYENWLSALKNIDAQKIAFEKTEEKFRQGMVDAYGYFSAKNNLYAAQISLLQTKYTYYYQSVLLHWYTTNDIK